MTGLPPELLALLNAQTSADYDEAWACFIAAYSPLLLHTARKVARDQDRTMDCYAFVLERLQKDDCAKLRHYQPHPGAKFSTWLVVVVQRLCLDKIRGEEGRSDLANPEERTTRRRLVHLIAEDLNTAKPIADPGEAPDEIAERRELSATLQHAIEQLSEADRLLLALRFEDDCSAREIAELLGMPTTFHAFRALRSVLTKLRRALSAQGFRSFGP